MSWLENLRPKIRALVTRDVPENLWVKCAACDQMIFHRELDANLKVCPHCGHHMRIAVRERLAACSTRVRSRRSNRRRRSWIR